MKNSLRTKNISGILENSLLPLRGKKGDNTTISKQAKVVMPVCKAASFNCFLTGFYDTVQNAQLETVHIVQCEGACNASPKLKPLEQLVFEKGVRDRDSSKQCAYCYLYKTDQAKPLVPAVHVQREKKVNSLMLYNYY